MFPWFFYWAPQLHYPWGGAVNQNIAPSAFFGAIKPAAGDGTVEHAVFDYASYGRQLGMLSDVVMVLLDRAGLATDVNELNEAPNTLAKRKADADEVLKEFGQRYNGIEKIKDVFKAGRIDTAINMLRSIEINDPDAVQAILTKFPPKKK